MLTARGLTVRYRGAATPALDRVDLTLGAGELLAVVGPNGSGKTTLQRALLGLAPLDAGEVTLDDRPIAQWSRQAIAERVGALPQREEPMLPLTVAETVLLGRWSRLGAVAPVNGDDEDAVRQALDRCDLRGMADRGIDTLSGGEWQRVRLARALAAAPRILLLDEPTAALDLAHEMELFELLRRLVAEGLGVLVITHQLNLAVRFADRVMLLDRGRVAAAGAPAEVLTPALLGSVFRWPVTVITGADGAPIITPDRAAAVSTVVSDPTLNEGRSS